MKIALGTIEVDEDMRRAIRAEVSQDGRLATRKEIRNTILSLATADLEAMVAMWREEQDALLFSASPDERRK